MRLAAMRWVCLAYALACTAGCGASDPATTQPTALAPVATAPSEAASDSEQAGHCERLSARLCGDLGPTTETCELVKERTAEIPENHCAAMLDHYGEVLDELEEQEARSRPLPPEQAALSIANATTTSGPENAPITVVLFSDFQCPYCAGAASATHEIQQAYGDKVRVVFRQFPLPFHRNAHLAAEASLAAHAQGKFWPMHDLLFANQGALDRESLSAYARELQLDVAAFDRALDGHTFSNAVDADLQLGVSLGVNGTPTMFLNRKRVPNASDVESLHALIDAQLDSATPAAD